MAWSPVQRIAGLIWVEAPGDYATLNSNQLRDGTKRETRIDWSTLPGFEADYRTRRLRTPPWLTERQRRAIEGFYANCPRGYHVNHIVPLRRSRVAGLHVLENLQYLPGAPNLRKDYRFRCTDEEAMNLVRLGMAVVWIDIREDGSVNWAPYRPMPTLSS